MLIFMTQFAGNEPMAAAFGAGAVLVMLRLVKLQRTAGPPAFGAAGLLWGLAVLSKVSALLLGPAFALALAFWCYSSRPGIKAAAARLFPFAVAFLLTCGWFFALNYARYGRAFVGGWSPETGYLWWQLPGYRTPQQYLSFGRALAHPVFASVYGFWDAMYAGLWFDSNQGGIIQRGFHPKWAYRFAESALLWAAIPTIAILAGSIRAVLPRRRVHPTDASRSHAHFTLVLSLCVIGSYGAAILGHSLLVPYYSVLKASYALAALPSLAVLIAAGFEPLMRYRTTRALLHAWIAGWVVLVYAGYWVRGP
jgi:hypothetical protein